MKSNGIDDARQSIENDARYQISMDNDMFMSFVVSLTINEDSSLGIFGNPIKRIGCVYNAL